MTVHSLLRLPVGFRLIVGTGKYKSGQETARAIAASGAEMVTVAVRRVNLDRSKESLLDFIDPEKYFLLPNTAGCYTADEAIRAARLGREVGLSDWVKIEVIGDQQTFYPDVQATIEATRVLVKEGFTVLPYTSDDVVVAKRFGCWRFSSYASGRAHWQWDGNTESSEHSNFARSYYRLPLILDAGVGTASDATIAMELGVDGSADEYRYRRGPGSCPHGRGHEDTRYRRTAGVPRGPDDEEAVRDASSPLLRAVLIASQEARPSGTRLIMFFFPCTTVPGFHIPPLRGWADTAALKRPRHPKAATATR